MYSNNQAKLVSLIEAAFAQREMPSVFISQDRLSPHEHTEASYFSAKHWSTITCDELEEHHEAIFWFSPEAFCFYLPGILCAGIRENEPEILVNHALIGMLDRTPDPQMWDEFFQTRWTLLNRRECEAVQEWVLWLATFNNSSFSESSLTRAFDCLEALKADKNFSI